MNLSHNRFDYVRFDEIALRVQGRFKDSFQVMEKDVEAYLPDSRAKELAIAKLEEAYMWIGKAIRDDQIARSGSAKPTTQGCGHDD